MNNIVANVATGIPAKFHVVQKSMPYTYDKSIIDYITLTIGSKESMCINLTIPVRDTTKHISLDHIDASKSGKSCTIDDVEIRGQKTKDMFYFAATLLKTLTHKTIVEFTDESHFPCNISDTEIRNIPLNTSYLMFYGKTWYDKQFNAMLVDLADQEKYARLQARRNDPSYKPASFNFKSPSLNEALMPLYRHKHMGRFF